MSSQLLDTPSRHSPYSFLAFVDSAWNVLSEFAFSHPPPAAAAAAAANGVGPPLPLARIAEWAVTAVLRNIEQGQLRIVTPRTTYRFPESIPGGEGEGSLQAEFTVVKDTFWLRLAALSDLGFGESYMYGEIECDTDNLISVFKIFLRNRQRIQNLDSKFSFLFSLPQKILSSRRFVNSLDNCRKNISAHYDISNRMFEGFLSRDMTYSCAIFEDLDGDLKNSDKERRSGERLSLPSEIPARRQIGVEYEHNLPTPLTSTTATPTNEPATGAEDHDHDHTLHVGSDGETEVDELYKAQLRKVDHIIRAARIRPGQRVLEIGSGWGFLALRIAGRFPGTTVDTLTLSVHQQTLAQERIARAQAEARARARARKEHDADADEGDDNDDDDDIAHRVRVHLMDYRSMPREWAGSFDSVISVEMVEAVGLEYLEEYFRVIDWALKPDVGVGVVQGITIPEARFERYKQEVDFIRKWVIFPGGILPTLTLLVQSLCAGSKGRLVVDSVVNVGPHYARTLREWRRRFERRFGDVVEPALRAEHPGFFGGGGERGDGDGEGERERERERGRREVEVFKRKWIYYYCYCEVGFTTRSLGDHIITFTREGNASFGCSVFE